jgi:hypothetical protein
MNKRQVSGFTEWNTQVQFFCLLDTDFGNGRMSLENTLLTQLKSNVQIFDALRQNLL